MGSSANCVSCCVDRRNPWWVFENYPHLSTHSSQSEGRLPSKSLSFTVCLHVESSFTIWITTRSSPLPSSSNIGFWSYGLIPLPALLTEYIWGEWVGWLERHVWDCLGVASNNLLESRVNLSHPLENTKLFPCVQRSSGFLPRLSWQGFWVWVCLFGWLVFGYLFFVVPIAYLMGIYFPLSPEVDFPCILAVLVCYPRGVGPSTVGTVLCTVN